MRRRLEEEKAAETKEKLELQALRARLEDEKARESERALSGERAREDLQNELLRNAEGSARREADLEAERARWESEARKSADEVSRLQGELAAAHAKAEDAAKRSDGVLEAMQRLEAEVRRLREEGPRDSSVMHTHSHMLAPGFPGGDAAAAGVEDGRPTAATVAVLEERAKTLEDALERKRGKKRLYKTKLAEASRTAESRIASLTDELNRALRDRSAAAAEAEQLRGTSARCHALEGALSRAEAEYGALLEEIQRLRDAEALRARMDELGLALNVSEATEALQALQGALNERDRLARALDAAQADAMAARALVVPSQPKAVTFDVAVGPDRAEKVPEEKALRDRASQANIELMAVGGGRPDRRALAGWNA